MHKIDVSVIIINFNTKDLTLECIKSVYEKTCCTSFEVIVIDNASTDGSRLLLSNLGFSNYHYIYNKKNVGFSRANNKAAGLAKGRYIFFMNSDMLFIDDVLSGLMMYMESNPGVGIAGPMFLNPDNTLQISCRNFPCIAFGFLKFFPFLKIFMSKEIREYYQQDRDYSKIQEVDTVSAGAMMIKKSLFKDIGGFDEFSFMYAEDADICRRVRDMGFKVVFLPDVKLIHYGGQSCALNSFRAVWSYYFAFYYLYKKYYFGRFAFLFKPFFFVRAVIAIVINMFKKDKRLTWNDKSSNCVKL